MASAIVRHGPRQGDCSKGHKHFPVEGDVECRANVVSCKLQVSRL
jgi:hypothetical protein